MWTSTRTFHAREVSDFGDTNYHFSSSALADRVIRIIEKINEHEGVEWVKMEDICDYFKSKNTAKKGALMPAKEGARLDNPDLQLEKKE